MSSGPIAWSIDSVRDRLSVVAIMAVIAGALEFARVVWLLERREPDWRAGPLMRDLCMPGNKPNRDITPVVHGVRIHLRELRERAGLTQEEVAEALDTSHATISRRETGVIPILSRDLAAIAKAYRCDVKEIFSLADEAATSGFDPRGGQVRLLQQRIAELREDRNAWRSQAQMLVSNHNKPA